MTEVCHLDTMHIPTVTGLEGLCLKDYILKFEPFTKLTLSFIILSCPHYFYNGCIFKNRKSIIVQLFLHGCIFSGWGVNL